MGNIATVIKGQSMTFMSTDESGKNKQRLSHAYTENMKADPEFFNKLSKEADDNDSQLADFILDHGLSFPTCELDMTKSGGFIDKLTED